MYSLQHLLLSEMKKKNGESLQINKNKTKQKYFASLDR